MADRTYVLLPGRHHLFTKYQWAELQRIVAGESEAHDGTRAAPGSTVVVAITSANHSNTRRNPVPAELRAAQAHLAAREHDIDCLTACIADVATTDRFAEHIVGAIAADESICDASGRPLQLTPENCVVATSTPALARQFAARGFAIFGMEHVDSPLHGPVDGRDLWRLPRPWQLVESIAASGGSLDTEVVAEHLHPASHWVWRQHRLGLRVASLFADPVASADSDLTLGRDYFTYMDSFDRGAERKWTLLEPHIEPGRIVDIGCATGSILALAGETAALAESDLIGIELSRTLYDECLHRRRMGAFANENTFFYHRNAMEALFPSRSVNTTLTVSLTHEIVSYIDESALDALSQSVFDQTASGGVWLIYDVCAPTDQNRIVRMTLDDDMGIAAAEAAEADHTAMSVTELGGWLDSLSVRARFDVFATTFRAEQGEAPDQVGSVIRNDDGSIDLRIGDAMDFLAHHTYTESWRSEMNERFCYRDLAQWRQALESIGFCVEAASRSWTNPWLAQHRFAPVASFVDPSSGSPIPWGETNLLIVARRP